MMDAVSKEFEEKMHFFIDHRWIRTARIVCRWIAVRVSMFDSVYWFLLIMFMGDI
jgi:hypothetical protein